MDKILNEIDITRILEEKLIKNIRNLETIGKPIEIQVNKQDQHIDGTYAQVFLLLFQYYELIN